MKKLFLIIGAPGSGKTTDAELIAKKHENITHYSTGDMLRAEMAKNSEIGKEIDSLANNKMPLTLAITDSSGKLVKSQIDVVQLRALTIPFLQKDITVKPVKQFYKESVFNDLTTVSTIMNYTTNKDSLPVKSVDILLNAKNNSEIKRVDMKVIYDKADSVITENYSWIFKKAFYVLRYAQAANGKGVATKINVSWEK